MYKNSFSTVDINIQSKITVKPLSLLANIVQASLVLGNVSLHILPQFKLLNDFHLFWLTAMILWFLFILIIRPSFYRKLQSPMLAMLFFMFYTVIAPFLFGNPTIGNRYLSLAQIPFYYFAFSFNNATGNNKTNILIIKLLIPLILFTSFNTIRGLLVNPYLSRNIKTSGEASIEMWSQGIGGYDFIYFITILSIIIFVLIFFGKGSFLNNKQRIGGLFLLIMLVANILLANYFTALIMLITAFSVYLLLRKFTFLKFFIILFVVAVFIVLGDRLLCFFIDFLIQVLPEGKTIEKLNIMKLDILYGNQTSVAEGRDSTILSSIGGFLKQPVFGLIIEPINVSGNYFTGFGQHSQFFDTLALYGIFGGGQIYIIVKPFILRLKKFRNLRAFTLAVFSAVLVLNIFNNSAPLIGFAFFFIYPTVYSWLREKLDRLMILGHIKTTV